MKSLIFDIDNTLCTKKQSDQSYLDVQPKMDVVNKLKEYKNKGYNIILHTARQMRTYEGNLGKINKNTAPITLEWLEKYDIPYDEIYFGKPWCGNGGFHVDDRSVRPSELIKYSEEEIQAMLDKESEI